MPQNIDFYYDIVSPYSYLAAVQMAGLEQETNAQVTWKPIFLGGLFKQIGNGAPLGLKTKKLYMLNQDVPRSAAALQVPYCCPQVFPTNTLTIQRCLAALPAAERPALSLKLYHLYWGQGQDVGQPEVVSQLLTDELLATAATEAAKAQLKAYTDEAIERGAFGSPSLFWEDQLYFGSDRIELLKQALLAAEAQ